MNGGLVQRIVGTVILAISLSFLPPIALALYYGDGGLQPFLDSLLVAIAAGALLWFPARKAHGDLRLRDGFLVTALIWVAMSLVCALPLYLAPQLRLTPGGAVFESVSGLTTTGATVITGLDSLPHSILYFRQQTNWIGGMGIIVLAVAILPMLGVGGMQLYRAETPGPIKDSKLTPRITETAKSLWFIYVGLTALCALCYWIAGMSLFDAVGHSFAALATGGFSTHDASIGYFHSPAIDIISIVFMWLAGANFSLHFFAWRRATLKGYLRDSEFRLYTRVLVVVSLITAGYLVLHNVYGSVHEAFLKSFFQVVSIVTSTGFTTANFSAWPGFLPMLLMFASVIGGCAGSTAGGTKSIRVYLVFKQALREIGRLVHPNAAMVVKMNGRAVPDRVIESVVAFMAAYAAIFVLMTLLLMATGLDTVSAISAVTACINNLGPGLGKVASNFTQVSEFGKWLMSLTMLMGRLEIFTILILFTPAFWRR